MLKFSNYKISITGDTNRVRNLQADDSQTERKLANMCINFHGTTVTVWPQSS